MLIKLFKSANVTGEKLRKFLRKNNNLFNELPGGISDKFILFMIVWQTEHCKERNKTIWKKLRQTLADRENRAKRK